MKKLFIAVSFLLLVTLAIGAQYAIKRQFGEPEQNKGYSPAQNKEFTDDWVDYDAMYFFTSDSLSVGDWVIYDQTVVCCVDTYDASGAGAGTYDTATIADSIKHYAWYQLYTYNSAASNDSTVIVGTDSANATQCDTIVNASGADDVWSTYKWRKVNLVYVLNSGGNIAVNFVPYGGVEKTTNAGTKWVAGVAAEERGADSLAKIIVSGYYPAAKILGATTLIRCGSPLAIGATAGYATVATRQYATCGVALANAQANGTYPVLIQPNPFTQDSIATIWAKTTFGGGSTVTGSCTFSVECTSDTVVISGAGASDHYCIQALGTTAWTAAPTFSAVAGSLFVYCAEADTAKARGSGIQWFRIAQ